ncbi:MAG: AMP-binding protein [Burkholderiales bacterium]|nr:AMP-binding protein [Burkholderiales bacterium]
MNHAATAEAAPAAAADALLALVDATLRELHADTAELPPVTLGSELDRDLGFDSLGRTELLLRIERRFGVNLPEDTLARAETVTDLLQALQRASPRAAAVAPPRLAAPPSVSEPAVAGDAAEAGPLAGSPAEAGTLLEVLAWHVRAHPGRTQVTVLQDQEQHAISYGVLAQRGATVAAALQAAQVAPRETVALMLPTSPEYFSTYLGILMAGAIPVPIYPPARPSQVEDHVLRHAALLDNARATVLVTVPEGRLVARLLQARVPGLRLVTTPARLHAHGGTPAPVAVRGEDTAFLQYTSGSTGNPKGVVLSHANVLANIRAMAQAIEASPRDVFVSWLPLYHDMGLIGAWLGSLYVGFPLVVMSPLAFLARPLRWLEAISQWGGTLTAAPNFAYELCLKQAEAGLPPGLDLRSLRVALNGAEAVRPATVQRFGERFAACGLRPEAMTPVYGLAEASVGLLFPPPGRAAVVDAVRRDALTREGRALPADPGDATALRFVACGRPLDGHEVRIVDAGGREVTQDRVEGRLEFRGPSATRGYFRDPRKTAQLFHDGWLDTGDRAYAAGGDFYITGRVKDIVIRGGRHFYPEEIEEAVARVAGIRKGCVAVFGSADAAAGTERLVVLAEVRPGAATAGLREAVARAVVDTVGEPPDDIVLAAPHTVLKTSSGKVRRSACRELVERGGADTGPAPLHRQLLRLALGAAGMRVRRAAALAARAGYALCAGMLFGLLAPGVWLATLVLPRPRAAWALGHAAARVALALAGMGPRVSGREHLPAGPYVLVSNHASYLDGVILIAALPRPHAFVAKRELAAQRVAGSYLRRIGAVFVERFEAGRAVEDARALAAPLARGVPLLAFPEGTFIAQPGLLPFHLGAFLVAVQAGVPVVPLAIRGDREALPDGTWWPRHVRLEVEIGAPLAPPQGAADAFAAAVQLRDAARQAIASRAAAGAAGEVR